MAEGGGRPPSMTENIIKQGYLKKFISPNELIPSTSKQLATNILQKFEPMRWYVFGVREGKPYLEYYEKEEKVFTGKAVQVYDLSTYLGISYTLGRVNKNYTFCIHLRDTVLELTAPKRAHMVNWCRTLERSLHHLGYGDGSAKADHHYSAFPVRHQPRKSSDTDTLIPNIPEGNPSELQYGAEALVLDEENAGFGYLDPTIISSSAEEEEEEEEEVGAAGDDTNDYMRPSSPCKQAVDSEENVFASLYSVRRTESGEDSLPVTQEEQPVMRKKTTTIQEFDTSEDDFVSKSFWIQNRKSAMPDLISFGDDEASSQSSSSAVSISADRKELPGLPVSNYDVPPPLPERRNPDSVDVGQSKLKRCVSMIDNRSLPLKGTGMDKSPPLNVIKQINSFQTDLSPPPLPVKPGNKHNVHIISVTSGKKPVSSKSSEFAVQELSEGDYETLETSNRTSFDKSKHCFGNPQYETSWTVQQHRDLSCQGTLIVDLPEKSPSASTDPVECIGEKLYVALPPQNDNMRREPAGLARQNSAPNADQDDSGNFYSDFPVGNSANTVIKREIDSDILKMSRENGEIPDGEISDPVLPKRTHFPGLSKSVRDQSSGQRQTSNGLPQSSVNGQARSWESNQPDDSPVAPPRRKKGPVESGITHACDNGKFSTVINLQKDQGTFSKSVSLDMAEPPLPPRPNFSEAPPPPPRIVRLVRSTTCVDDFSRVKHRHMARSVRPVFSEPVHVMKLKHLQVDNLRAEIESSGGMVQTISKLQFQHGLALVECFDRIWIAGWDLKKFPKLHNKFHIGDQLLMVNDVQVNDLPFAQKLIKNVKADLVEITVKRLPNAKVYAVQRSAEGQSLGIKREGGTAEIVYVDPHGLANRHGLTNKVSNMNGDGVCNWWLTEINNRSLNLTFKDNEIEHRLSAVGKDISFVVQPSDYMKELKKQLKKLRGFKDFLVQ